MDFLQDFKKTGCDGMATSLVRARLSVGRERRLSPWERGRLVRKGTTLRVDEGRMPAFPEESSDQVE